MSGERLFCVILTAPPPVNPVPHRCFRRQHDKSRQISTCARSLAPLACFSIAINRTGGLFRRPLVNFHHRTTDLSPRSRTCIAVADGPARRAASCASCGTQRWTLGVTHWPKSSLLANRVCNTLRRKFQWEVGLPFLIFGDTRRIFLKHSVGYRSKEASSANGPIRGRQKVLKKRRKSRGKERGEGKKCMHGKN